MLGFQGHFMRLLDLVWKHQPLGATVGHFVEVITTYNQVTLREGDDPP